MAEVYWWEVCAPFRGAVIALQQAKRYLTGGKKTRHLALTGLISVELEVELLRLTGPVVELPREVARRLTSLK